MWQSKKVLVTGGVGFIGNNLAKRLVSMGADVTITEHLKDCAENQGLYKRDGMNIIQCDLLKKQDCDYIVRFGEDFVIHCAAVTHGALKIKEDPMSLVIPSTIINTLMLDACYKNQIKNVVFISSSVVYPNMGNFPVIEEDAENSEPPPIYFHVGNMKKYFEKMLKCYCEKVKNPIKGIVIRPSNIFGIKDDYEPATSHVVPALIRKIVERNNPIEVWGTGDDIRDILYIDDFIDGLILACEKIDTFKTINISYGEAFSVKEILKMLFEIENFYPQIVYNSDKPSMLKERRISNKLAKELLNWEPKHTVKEALKKTIDWYKENRI